MKSARKENLKMNDYKLMKRIAEAIKDSRLCFISTSKKGNPVLLLSLIHQEKGELIIEPISEVSELDALDYEKPNLDSIFDVRLFQDMGTMH